MSVTTSDATLPTDVNTIVNGFMQDFASFLEVQIKSKWEDIQFFKNMLDGNPDSDTAKQQIELLTAGLQTLIKQLMELRKDSDFMMPDTKQIISNEGYCGNCGESHGLESFDFKIDSNFKSILTEADFDAFTNSSSFVGNVRYDRDTQEMTIILNSKEYSFCNVPARKFETLRGANSVGAAFNREIKGQHDC